MVSLGGQHPISGLAHRQADQLRLTIKKTFMNDIYAMRRANGDWFAFDDDGRFRVPIFHSSNDGMIARSRNKEMLLFKPVALDAHLLKQLVPAGGEGEVDFCIVRDPSGDLDRGSLVKLAHVASLITA